MMILPQVMLHFLISLFFSKISLWSHLSSPLFLLYPWIMAPAASLFLPSQSLCILQASLYLFLTLFPLSRLVYLAGSFIGSSDQSFLLLLTPKCLYLLIHQMDFLLEFLNYFSTTCNVPPVFVLSLFSISTLLNLKMLIIDFLLSTLHHHFPLMFICT